MREFGRRYDRRTFLARGAGAAAVFAVGGVGASALSSCGTSNPNNPLARGKAGIGSGTPKRGGTVTIGMNSEIDGFLPSASHFDNTGLTYATTVFDSLTKIAADGSAKPYLAQSVTPNTDLTIWTVMLRPGVTFHDGSALDADVVIANWQQVKSSALTGQAVKPISTVTKTSDLEVQFIADEPLVAFPAYLSTQLGYVVALSQLNASSPDNSTKPIGTGPYKIVEWVPNDHFTVERNPAYWRKGLPYLDGITFKPIIEDD
ncbi:MAG: ABC transporter substrate-binding protein, partial [Acidimicrobiales bacterium]